jgi:rare lipoprotein A
LIRPAQSDVGGLRNVQLLVAGLLAAVLLTGCQSGAPKPGGGFYGGDRPPDTIPEDLAAIPDAVPVALPRSPTGNDPYRALGKSWRPLKSARGYRARGMASWYGRKFHGRRTSSGEPYDMFAMANMS